MSLSTIPRQGVCGQPSHPPLTDVSVGAYTVGVAMLIAGAAGLEQEAMAKGTLLAIIGGVIVAIPTALTGLLDYFDLPTGSAARTLATYHLFVMPAATALIAATWVAQRHGYLDGEVTTLGLTTLGLILGVAAFARAHARQRHARRHAGVHLRCARHQRESSDRRRADPGRLEEPAALDAAGGARTDRTGGFRSG